MLLCTISFMILPLKCPNTFMDLEDSLFFNNETHKKFSSNYFPSNKNCIFLSSVDKDQPIYSPNIFAKSSVVSGLLLQSFSCRQ